MTDIKSILRQTIDNQIANQPNAVKTGLVNAIQSRMRAQVQESMMARGPDAPNYSHSDGIGSATFVKFFEVSVDGSEPRLLLEPGDYELDEVEINYTVSGRPSPATRFEPAEEAELEFTVEKVTYSKWNESTEEFGAPQVVTGPDAVNYVPKDVYSSIYDQLMSLMQTGTGPFDNDNY